MNKSFYYDVNENKWKSVRGHNCPGAVWVDDATEDEIRVHLAKIPEIIKAQAEIAALRAENIRLLVRCDEKFDIIDNKGKLIEQMREALKTADILIDELVDTHVERCASVYDDDRNEIKAVLSAAERGE